MKYAVLGALILAGLVIALDQLRQRRRRRARPNVSRALVAALAVPSSAGVNTPLIDVGEPQGEPGEPEGIWLDLIDELDPGEWRPETAEGVEVRTFPVRWGDDYAIIASPDHTSHYQLEIWEAELTELMDGTRTVNELIVGRLEDEGQLDAAAVAGLVEMLRVEGLLEPQTIDVRNLVADRLDPASRGRRKLREFAKSLKIGWEGAERFTQRVYDGGLKYAFRPVGVVFSSALALGGLAALIASITSHRFHLELRAAPVEVAILVTLSFVLTFCHEEGHALVLVHYGRRVISSGFMIFFASPAFYVDASDAQMLNRNQRMLQAFAGAYAELVVAGVASLVLFAFPDAAFAPLLFRFAVINYFVIFENLIPLLRLDGYWILCELIEEPDLRGKSIAFIQRDLWHKLRRGSGGFTWQDVGLGLYGIVGTIYSVLSIWIGLYFWQRVFGGIVADLWHGGLVSQLLLVLLVLVFLGPLVRAMIDGARALIKRLKALVARIRFRFETKWRVEAAGLIDDLPGFDDLPEDVLSDLAGRVRLRTLPPGRAVFRMADRPDAFYVVRSGTVQVEDQDPETGDTRVLRTMSRGESFGELGLIGMAPRQAGVRALTSTELFEVDKGTFDRLLANSIHAPDFAPTMQAFAEVRALPPFRLLPTDKIEDVLRHGNWEMYEAGDLVIEQGEPGDAFYVIDSGQADVIRDERQVVTLGSGQHFGELALLNDAPRNASVVARSALRTFRLDREGFDSVVADDFRKGTPDQPRRRDMEH